MKTLTHAWRTDKPPVGQEVEVWLFTKVVAATWDGDKWKTAHGEFTDKIITHWRERV